MTPIDSARHATELLLASMFYLRAPERRRHQFMYKRPGQTNPFGNMGIEINYDQRASLKAKLYLRRNAAPHLRSLSVRDVGSRISEFVREYFWTISSEVWCGRSEHAFGTFVSPGAKEAFAQAMVSSSLFVEPRELTLFPLVVLRVEDEFVAPDFFLVPPSGLTLERMPAKVLPGEIISKSFPPFELWTGVRRNPASWLGVWAANIDAAERYRAAILGAMALLPHHFERYLFTGRAVFGGHCTIANDRFTTSIGDSHTPALSEDIVITIADHDWLSILAAKLRSPIKTDKKQVRALEYYYRAWMPEPVRRFTTLFGALDAIFGDAGAATQAVITAVGPIMGPDYDYDRLKLLLSLRASVIHGGAPNVYESSSYHRYYERYETDATSDLELIVARCLQTVIFGGALVERPHTHADLIKKETGREV